MAESALEDGYLVYIKQIVNSVFATMPAGDLWAVSRGCERLNRAFAAFNRPVFVRRFDLAADSVVLDVVRWLDDERIREYDFVLGLT